MVLQMKKLIFWHVMAIKQCIDSEGPKDEPKKGNLDRNNNSIIEKIVLGTQDSSFFGA